MWERTAARGEHVEGKAFTEPCASAPALLTSALWVGPKQAHSLVQYGIPPPETDDPRIWQRWYREVTDKYEVGAPSPLPSVVALDM